MMLRAQQAIAEICAEAPAALLIAGAYEKDRGCGRG
jgi:hypothetical protein